MKLLSFIAVLALSVLPVGAAELDEAVKDIVGVWRLDFTTPDDEEMTPWVIVGRQHDELVAWAANEGNMQAFKDVRLDGDAVLLTIVPESRGGEVTVTFEAKLKEDGVCHGEAKYSTDSGETGVFDFTGKRTSVDNLDDVEKWKLSFTTPDDAQREALVTVVAMGDKLYGWYSSEDHELPAKEVTKDGDKVSLSITAKTSQGSEVDVTFSGTVDGDVVEGDAEYDLEGETGSFPFKGKRQS